ncbi:MAG: DUF4365 domain-containing protein [Sulfuricaulis sp.]
MNSQLTSAAPQESEAQRIGRLAGKAFCAAIPNDWIHSVLAEHDFGVDYQIQTKTGNEVRNMFRVQLKGTKSPSLNADGTFYSVTLELSTVNYLANVTEPILLALCLLPEDENIRDAKLFCIWIHDELKRLRGQAIDEKQESVTFRVPVANALDHRTDVTAYLERFRQLASVGNALDLTVQTSRPALDDEARAALVTRLPAGLARRSPSLIDAIADAPSSSWVEAKEGTTPWHLREAATATSAGRTDAAERHLKHVADVLTTLTPVEQADYWRQLGRVELHQGKNAQACDDFARACELAPNTPRHLAAWAEAELRISIEAGQEQDLASVLDRLQGTDPSVVAMRARVLVTMGKYIEAVAAAESIGGPERASTLAIVHLAGRELQRALDVCETELPNAQTLDYHRQALRLVRARVKFAQAVGGISDEEIPLSGHARADIDLLQAAWSDINELVSEYRASHWPMNVEVLADIWGLTASILGHRATTIPVMAEAASARPHAQGLQSILEGMAAVEGDYVRALEANQRLPATASNLVRRIMLFHATRRDVDCVNLMDREHANLDRDHKHYPVALGMATMSADRIVRPELAGQWAAELKTRDAWRAQAAQLAFFRNVAQNALAREAALAELEVAYTEQGRPLQLGAHLFYELDSSDAEQAAKVIELASEISATRLLDLDGCLHWAQALATMGKWEELAQFAEQQTRRFQPNDRLQAVRALALDKLGRTNEAQAVLEELIAKTSPDPIALNTYIVINSRLGFNDEAIVCLEKVLSTATSKGAKLRCLHGLFSIEYLRNPTGSRLLELALNIGELADQADEAEEGLYLVLMICATLTKHFDEGDARISAFQQRMKTFCTNFPNSKILKLASFPENASGAEMLRILRDMTGMTEEMWRQRVKTLNLVQRGQLPFPYAWRAHLLDGIPDLPTLWELGKRSKSDEPHLQLQMVGTDWEAIPHTELVTTIPFIDLVALFVLQDLNLLDELFKVFKKVAISKATLRSLQAFLTPMTASPFRDKCASLQQALKKHAANIEQPGVAASDDEEENGTRKLHEDLVEIAERGTYRLYSDDFIFRAGAELPTEAPKPMCTLDLLTALDELGYMSPEDVAKCFAKLCKWNVVVRITIRYQMAVLPASLASARSISARIEALREDPHASAMYEALWSIQKPFSDLRTHGASVLRDLICEKRSNISSVAALAALWVMKAKFHGEAPEHTLLPALLIVQAAAMVPPGDATLSARLWSVYGDIVEHEYGNQMDDSKYRTSREVLAHMAATLDVQASVPQEQSVGTRLYAGLTHGTSDFGIFDAAYSSKRIALQTAKAKKPR